MTLGRFPNGPGRPAPLIVGIGGTTRPLSSTELALRAALRAAEAAGARTRFFTGPQIAALPLYAPESPERVPGARDLIEGVRAAGGLIIASPGYHGTLSGLVKNALDYLEDTRTDPRPYLDGLPVGCIATGMGWQATVTTLTALRSVVHALRGWPTPMGAALNTTEVLFDGEGNASDPRAELQLRTVGRQVAEFALLRRDNVVSLAVDNPDALEAWA
jgi:FMN reductase